MSKYKLHVEDDAELAEEHVANGEQAEAAPSDDIVGKAATIAVVAAGVALFEVALIPGMVIGVAATLAPNLLPKLGSRMKPLLHTTVRGAYKISRKARSAVSEAQEQLQDIAAEVKAEQVATAQEKPATAAANAH
ncbi:DUF5132 domain-containing protein [Aquabacter sp. CN5-332]|uniref:DUF5132 domain-containing protein n=1 Tax=Aquabacter sp. CN5-332 TaxID=3156608 RepID=UPI0032B366F4